MDFTIGELETFRLGNEQKIDEIQRISSQLNKALAVNYMKITLYFFINSLSLDSEANSWFKRTTRSWSLSQGKLIMKRSKTFYL